MVPKGIFYIIIDRALTLPALSCLLYIDFYMDDPNRVFSRVKAKLILLTLGWGLNLVFIKD